MKYYESVKNILKFWRVFIIIYYMADKMNSDFPARCFFFGITVEKPSFLLYHAFCGDIDNFSKER